MTAQFDSQDPQDSGQQSSNDYENYVPEREFVLMPFFRRIGEMFGSRRSPAAEPNYAAQIVEEAPPEQFTSEEPPVTQILTAQDESRNPESASPVAESVDALPFEAPEHEPIPEPSRIAPLLDAAKNFSDAFSAANQWAERKTSDIFRRPQTAETGSAAPATPKEPIPFPTIEPAATTQQLETATAQPEEQASPAIEADAQLTVPALQREMAWEHSSESHVLVPPAAQQSASPDPGLPPIASWWQHRIDWSVYLTSKRVALLGGLAMAALIILGISLARRPAANMLPEQTATHTLEPGGVTLSTHPVLTRTSPPQHESSTPPHARVRTSRAFVDDGPEVVTHYYNQKPSPVHQATVDGVRHYSDLN